MSGLVQEPLVKLNNDLGGMLTFKLAAEELVRATGVPYVVVRPTALTEEPPGAPLEFDQGDNVRGKISRWAPLVAFPPPRFFLMSWTSPSSGQRALAASLVQGFLP